MTHKLYYQIMTAAVVAGVIIVWFTNQWWVVIPVGAAVGVVAVAKKMAESSDGESK